MKRYFVASILFFLFVLLAACSDGTISKPATSTPNPTAQALLETLAVIANTVEGIAGSATSYSYTPTFTPTLTITPDATEVNKTISNAIKDQLISTFGTKITVGDVKFGPIGAQQYTNLYIEINCAGDNNVACPTTNVIIAILDGCKDRKKKLLEIIPATTEVLTITIFDPLNNPKVVEINWSDVLAYIDEKVSGENLSERIRYVQ